MFFSLCFQNAILSERLTMQQTFLNILKKYFNVVKASADFFFCLVGYIWPKSIKDDVVLAMITRSGLR